MVKPLYSYYATLTLMGWVISGLEKKQWNFLRSWLWEGWEANPMNGVMEAENWNSFKLSHHIG